MFKQIISYNMAGWRWKVSKERWSERLTRSCEYIASKASKPFLIGLQEVQLSGGKHLKIIENFFGEEYYIVLPKAYDSQPKSVVSILLIRKEMCDSFTLGTLEGLLEASLRYNYVNINTSDGLCFRCLNCNVPHTCYDNFAPWFQDNRRVLRECFIDNINSLAETYRNEPDVKFICMGDMNSVPESTFIDSLAYGYINRPMIDSVKPIDKNKVTWRNNGSSNRLDYILYSQGMLNDTGISAQLTMIDDSPIILKMSDHAILIGGVAG